VAVSVGLFPRHGAADSVSVAADAGARHPLGASQNRRGFPVAGKFELWVDKAGEYRFNLKATNGQVIATSQGYSSKASALNGIDSVKTNAPDAEVVEIER